MTGPVLLDTTVLSNFAVVNRADLVIRLWGDIACITPAVLAEYQAGMACGLLTNAWTGLPVLDLTEDEERSANGLSTRLGAGERTCLAIAYHRHGLFATDDLDARNSARRLGVPTTGTVGILAACVRRGHLTREQANAILAKMVAAGYRSPVTCLDSLLES